MVKCDRCGGETKMVHRKSKTGNPISFYVCQGIEGVTEMQCKNGHFPYSMPAWLVKKPEPPGRVVQMDNQPQPTAPKQRPVPQSQQKGNLSEYGLIINKLDLLSKKIDTVIANQNQI